jgi:uncharacterized paraquat-inducible protein A
MAMTLKCPHCRNGIDAAELRRQSGTGGGYECPACKQMVRFAQPHAIFRRAVSLLLAAIVLMICGVRNPLMLVIGSILLWVPMSIAVNMYCVYAMPVGLRPWKQRGRKPFDEGPPELFNNRPK